MKKTSALITVISLFSFFLMTLASCKKEKEAPFYLFVDNPFNFDIKIQGHLKGCGFSGDGCLHYSGKIYEGETLGQSGNVYAYNATTGQQVGAVNYEGSGGSYSWTVGYMSPLVKVESNGGNSGNNNSGGNGNNNGGGGSGNTDESSIVFYSTGNIDECEYVEVSVSKDLKSNGDLKNPIIKTFKGIVKLPYDEQKDVSCGMSGAATFNLTSGKYYIKHRTVNCENMSHRDYAYQWRTLEKGKCIKIRLSR